MPGGTANMELRGLMLQHHGRWLRLQENAMAGRAGGEWRSGARALSHRSDARARAVLEDDAVEDDHVGAAEDVDIVKLRHAYQKSVMNETHTTLKETYY